MADCAAIDVVHLPQNVVDPFGPISPSRGSTVVPFPQSTAPGNAIEPAEGADEAAVLLDMLRRHRWNITDAAKDLGLCRATIYRRMKRHGIVSPTQFG